MQPPARKFEGVGVVAYRFLHNPDPGIHPLLSEMEAKVLRGEAVAEACYRLKTKGWSPDAVLAHPGWGEALFIREIWPKARLIMYCEYYYQAQSQDFNFDPEFKDNTATILQTLKLKNTVMLHALVDADVAYSATEWQRSTFPQWAQPKISVLHEGIDTGFFKPNPKATLTIANKNLVLKAGDEVITYAARALEPVRGFHIFMRALPEILKKRPNAHVVIMGHEEASYGPSPQGFTSWKEQLLKEMGHKLDPDHVHFTGFLPRDAYLAALQISRVHVYLTYPFLLSWSVLEAMACGTLVVGSATGPVQEVITDGTSGILTPFFDTKKLTQAIVKQLAAPNEQTKSIRAAARKTVMRDFSNKACTEKILKLLKGPRN